MAETWYLVSPSKSQPMTLISQCFQVFGWDLQELIDQGKLFHFSDASPDPERARLVGNFWISRA